MTRRLIRPAVSAWLVVAGLALTGGPWQAATPALIKDIETGGEGSFPSDFVVVGGTVFFVATSPLEGSELWKSDGAPGGAELVKDIMPGSGDSEINWMVDLAGTLLFTANDGVSGRELWSSDGTEVGTMMVRDINPGPNDSSPTRLTVVGGTVFFSVSSNQLWKSDRTFGGTAQVGTYSSIG